MLKCIFRYHYEKPFTYAIVGSGPAGLYTAKHLLRDNINVDIFEQDACPTGLIRYGMAPDHQQIKKVGEDLMAISAIDSCRYFGGVSIGKDYCIEQMEQDYSAIFFSFGSQGERNLNIPGEDLPHVYGSRQIVSWYNSHPSFYHFNVKIGRTVAIIGNGNVAIDIGRVFGQNIDRLKQTDVNPRTLEELSKRNVKNIIIIGRRGVVQSQFSLKELREFSKLHGFRFLLVKSDLMRSLNEASVAESTDKGPFYGNQTRANRRKLEFLREFEIIEDQESFDHLLSQKTEKINVIFRFLISPTEILNDRIMGTINQLQGQPFKQTTIPIGVTEIKCDTVITAIGYQAQNIDSQLAWDNDILKNSDGCLTSDGVNINIGKYCCGWVKTGATGVLNSTFASSEESIVNFRNHFNADLIQPKVQPNIKFDHFNFNDWHRINTYELEQGKLQNRVRSKEINFDMFKN